MQFKEITSSAAEKPEELDLTSSASKVYLRKDIEQVEREEGDQTIQEWKYKEAVLTREEYTSLAPFLSIESKQDASANNLGIIMEAIADLYEQLLSTEEGVTE